MDIGLNELVITARPAELYDRCVACEMLARSACPAAQLCDVPLDALILILSRAVLTRFEKGC